MNDKNFYTGKCPACGEELQIPERLEHFSCMYCGAKLQKGDLVTESRKKADGSLKEQLSQLLEKKADPSEIEELIRMIREQDYEDREANAAYVTLHFRELLFADPQAMTYFTRNHYKQYFEDLVLKHRGLADALRFAMTGTEEENRALAQPWADDMVAGVVQEVKKGRRIKHDQVMNYRMCVVVYVVPLLMKIDPAIGNCVGDALFEAWRKEFPKDTFEKSTFEEIHAGFKRGKLCFITTAVCNSFGKPDDCYELESFRAFRDTVLLPDPEGRALVEEYYDIAPGIVMCMEQEPKKDELFLKIWDTYLKECLLAIEEGRNEDCKNTYVDMVRTMEKRYLQM